MSMVDITKMYIAAFKAAVRCGSKDDDNGLEYIGLIQAMVNEINDNIKFYDIKYDDGADRGEVTELEVLECYIEQLSKKYLNIDNIWVHPLWISPVFPYDITEERKKERKILSSIKNEKDVKEFLDWWKGIQSGIVCQFNYRVIDEDNISNVIHNTNYTDLIVAINDYDFTSNDYNPIITWVDNAAETTLYIVNIVSLKNMMFDQGWIDTHPEILESFYEKFDVQTLEGYIEEEYSELHPEVQKALIQEVKEFYEIYKDEIVLNKDGDAEVPSEGLWLIDAIWNHAPLFCNNTIGYIVEKLYKRELKL